MKNETETNRRLNDAVAGVDRFLEFNQHIDVETPISRCRVDGLTLGMIQELRMAIDSAPPASQTVTDKIVEDLEVLHEATMDSPLIHAAYGNALHIINRSRR